VTSTPSGSGARSVTSVRRGGERSESELAFATLHQLLAPRLDRLPAPRALALGAALGIAPADGGDRFLVAAALLSLLGEIAEERPLGWPEPR
jgi:hypothetical protein